MPEFELAVPDLLLVLTVAVVVPFI